MTQEIRFPSQYAVHQALAEFCQRQFVDEFAQKRGVFITNVTLDSLAKFLSSLLYENKDLELIRNEALQMNAKRTLSGIQVDSQAEAFNLVDEMESHIGNIVEPKTEMKLTRITEIPQEAASIYHGNVAYLQKKPGRVQFLQSVSRFFEFYVRPLLGGRWEVLIDCQRSNDARIMGRWVKRLVPNETTLTVVDQARLSTTQTIEFFDELGKRGASNEWEFTQVKRIVLRKADPIDDESVDEDTERVETEQTVLSGITQAILEGNELRNNSFVKQSEEGGYRFTAMTYEYTHKHHPYIKQVRAEFKKRPKVFEVALDSYKRRVGLDEGLVNEHLTESERIELLSQFWRRAQFVFMGLVQREDDSPG